MTVWFVGPGHLLLSLHGPFQMLFGFEVRVQVLVIQPLLSMYTTETRLLMNLVDGQPGPSLFLLLDDFDR